MKKLILLFLLFILVSCATSKKYLVYTIRSGTLQADRVEIYNSKVRIYFDEYSDEYITIDRATDYVNHIKNNK